MGSDPYNAKKKYGSDPDPDTQHPPMTQIQQASYRFIPCTKGKAFFDKN